MVSSLRAQQRMSPEADKLGVSPNEGTVENVNGAYVFGTGLQNEVGEYNCFLNVIIQAMSYFPSHIFINAVSFLCFIYGVFSGLKCCFFPFPLAWTQSLWHLRRFRDEFLRKAESGHVHVGDPCVVCALYEIFTALSDASTDMRREAVAPSSLRIALSNLYPESNFFQEVV